MVQSEKELFFSPGVHADQFLLIYIFFFPWSYNSSVSRVGLGMRRREQSVETDIAEEVLVKSQCQEAVLV